MAATQKATLNIMKKLPENQGLKNWKENRLLLSSLPFLFESRKTKTAIKLVHHINDIDDLPQLLLDQIREFFENYKNLEAGKWVKVENWQNAQAACAKIIAAAQAYQQQS